MDLHARRDAERARNEQFERDWASERQENTLEDAVQMVLDFQPHVPRDEIRGLCNQLFNERNGTTAQVAAAAIDILLSLESTLAAAPPAAPNAVMSDDGLVLERIVEDAVIVISQVFSDMSPDEIRARTFALMMDFGGVQCEASALADAVIDTILAV
jgi:hypothetical protein